MSAPRRRRGGGTKGKAQFNALIASIRSRHNHGLYEPVHNALWQFSPDEFGAWMSAALPAFIKRMNRHDQVSRFLCPLMGWAKRRYLPAFAAGVKGLPPAGQRAVSRAMRRWAVEDKDWWQILEALGVARPPDKPMPPIPQGWPARWSAVLRRHIDTGADLGAVWTWRRRADTLGFLASLAGMATGPLADELPAVLTPLGTFATRYRPEFARAIVALPAVERDHARSALAKAARRPGVFKLAWRDIEQQIRASR